MAAPLADRLRPQSLDDIVGQHHLLDPDKALRRIIDSGDIPNMIFYGPSGIGKTTLASIIAKQTERSLYKLNGTTASTADIRNSLTPLPRRTEFCFIWMKFSILIRSSSRRFWSLLKTARLR